MKGSAVAQGLKSITDRLHPQLPLTSRESRQLLTALTTSFRRHLDEAHPDNTDENGQKHVVVGDIQAGVRKVKSSAVYADRHLASVLTNPLLAKLPTEHGPTSDYDSARTTLAQNRSRDPILIFEDFDKEGIATVAIAELCLDALKQSLDSLLPEDRSRKAKDAEPGRKVFLWLLRNQHLASPAFVDSPRLVDLMCYLLHLEGREAAIWQWLQLDVTSQDTNTISFKSDSKLKLHQYRWRSRVISALVRTKLGELDTQSRKIGLEEVHAAMDAFIAAFELRQTAQPGHHLHSFSLTAAAWALRTALVSPFSSRNRLDVRKYDSFLEIIPAIFPKTLTSQSYVAGLQLRHPNNPSTDLAWTITKFVLMNAPSREGQKILHSIKMDETQPKSRYWYSFFLSTAHSLGAEGRLDDASWVKSRVIEAFPLLSSNLEMDLRAQNFQGTSSTQRKTNRNQRSRIIEGLPDGAFVPSFG